MTEQQFQAAIQTAIDKGQQLFWTLNVYRQFTLKAVTYTWENGSARHKRLWCDNANRSSWRGSFELNARLIAAGARIDPRNWRNVAEKRWADYGLPYCEGQEQDAIPAL